MTLQKLSIILKMSHKIKCHSTGVDDVDDDNDCDSNIDMVGDDVRHLK